MHSLAQPLNRIMFGLDLKIITWLKYNIITLFSFSLKSQECGLHGCRDAYSKAPVG